VSEFILRLLVLLRFLCFVALVYLALQVIFSRLISKPASKVLWFFSVLTLPLMRPVRTWLAPDASESRLRSAALVFYGALWLLIFIITEMVAETFR
jgi:hypothetical protein